MSITAAQKARPFGSQSMGGPPPFWAFDDAAIKSVAGRLLDLTLGEYTNVVMFYGRVDQKGMVWRTRGIAWLWVKVSCWSEEGGSRSKRFDAGTDEFNALYACVPAEKRGLPEKEEKPMDKLLGERAPMPEGNLIVKRMRVSPTASGAMTDASKIPDCKDYIARLKAKGRIKVAEPLASIDAAMAAKTKEGKGMQSEVFGEWKISLRVTRKERSKLEKAASVAGDSFDVWARNKLMASVA